MIIESTITKLAARYSKIDQEKLVDVIREIVRGDDSVMLLPTDVRSRSDIIIGPHHLARLSAAELGDVEDAECKIDVPNANLMFVYQSAEMKRLYRRYGGLLLVVDALHRASRYPLLVFFLLVRTNVNFQVVAVIVVQQETRQSLVNALHVVRRWNSDVCPRFALVDFSDEEITALEETFPGYFVVEYSCCFRVLFN